MEKDVTIVEHHHEVLEAWCRTSGHNVITLDYHTDSYTALLNYSHYEAVKSLGADSHPDFPEMRRRIADDEIASYRQTKDIRRAISLLKFDEHIDFAVRAGIINRSFALVKHDGYNSTVNDNVYSIERQHPKYRGQKIMEYQPTCLPGCKREPHNDDCWIDVSSNSIDDVVLGGAISKFSEYEPNLLTDFILDIDCDYFTSIRSLTPHSMSIFKDLIKRSTLITIALESSCVELCRLDHETITSQMICDRILGIIKSI